VTGGGRGPTGRFWYWYPQVCIEGLSQKKIGSAPPPRCPPGPGFLGANLVRSAEGLPSPRDGPGRWPVSLTSPPQVAGDVPGPVCRQLAGAVVFGGGALHQRHHSRAAGAPALLQFEWLSKTRGAQAPGWLSYVHWSRPGMPGGAGGRRRRRGGGGRKGGEGKGGGLWLWESGARRRPRH
jgi:hypothetical protein